MLSLLAAAPEDGWAFVGRGGDILLLKPPYQRSNLFTVSEDTVERAVAQHGFVSLEGQQFQDWAELIAFLKSLLLQSRKESGRFVPEADAVRRLVEFAPTYILKGYLDRIRDELIPMRELQAAFDLLTAILRAESVRTDPGLHAQALEALEGCQRQWLADEARRLELVDEGLDILQQFPNTARRYGTEVVIAAVNNVQRTHSLWA